MLRSIVVLFVVLALGHGQDANQIQQDLEKKFQEIPNVDMEQFNKTAADFDKAFREKCEKNGGPGAYDAIKDMKDQVQSCFEAQVNATTLMQELEDSKPTGSMDEVFAKYCKKTPELINCTKAVTDKVEQCLEPAEKENMKIVLNVTKNLAEFVCNKDGDRLAMFVAEGGKECLEARKDDIQNCVNETFGSRMPKEFSIETMPLLLFDDQQCQDFISLQECTVKELEKCSDKTPANIIEALFKFIYKSIPCKAAQTLNTVFKRQVDQTTQSQPPPVLDEKQFVDQTIKSIFYYKCLKYANDQKYFATEKLFNDLQVVLRNIYQPEMTCPKYKNDVLDVMRKLSLEITLCLSPAERYIGDFLLKGTDSALNYVCDRNDMSRLMKLFDPNALQCLMASQVDSLNNCFFLSQSQKKIAENELIVTKQELCKDMSNIKNCLTSHSVSQCQQNFEFNMLLNGTLESLLVECRPQQAVVFDHANVKKSNSDILGPEFTLIFSLITYLLHL